MGREVPQAEEDLADHLQRGRQRRGLLLFGGWGAAAIFSLSMAAVVAQKDLGRGHWEQAMAVAATPGANPRLDRASAAKLAETEQRAVLTETRTERLAAEVRTLSADRDRLSDRLASLEQKLDSITGSIKAPAATEPQATIETPARKAEASMPRDLGAKPAAPESDSASHGRAGTAEEDPARPGQLAAIHAPPAVGFMTSPQIATPLTMSADAAGGRTWPLDSAQARANTPRVVKTKSIRATADKAPPATEPIAAPAKAAEPDQPTQAKAAPAQALALAAVPMPPEREVAAKPVRPEIGVDLGRAETVDTVKAQWAAVKANFGHALAGLHPVFARDSRPGHGPYRLVIGTLPSMIAAARLCARFANGHVFCQPVHYAGQRVVRR